MSQRPAIAAFDFDGTLTTRDSMMPFLRQVAGPWHFRLGILLNSPVLLAYALKLLPNWRAKERLLTYFLAGLDEAHFAQAAAAFAQQHIPKLLRPEALARLRWHQQQGHKTILVSASMEAYLVPWAKSMGFDDVIATQLEVKHGKLTGRLRGKNCHGPEKTQRLTARIGDLSQYHLYAYGDSRGDRELLAAATQAYFRRFSD